MVNLTYLLAGLAVAGLVAGLVIRRRNYVKARDAYVESLMSKYKR